MDTQAMVTQLMRAESMRMERFQRRRTMIQWRQESIRTNMTRMNEFRSQHTDFIARGAINNPATWNTVRASVKNADGSTNTNGISVTAGNNAKISSFDIRVEQAAQGDTARGSVQHNHMNLNSNITTALVLATGGADHTFVNINGTNVRVNATDTVQNFMDRVNSSNAGVTLSFDTMRNRFVMESKTTGENAVIRTGAGASDGWNVLARMGLDGIRPGGGTGHGGAIVGNGNFTPITGGTVIGDAIPGITDTSFRITVNGTAHDINFNATDTFDELSDAVYAATGLSISFNNFGGFTIQGNGTSIIQIGDGNPNELLDFMGFTDNAVRNNAAFLNGIVTSAHPDLDDTSKTFGELLGDVFGPGDEAEFTVGGNTFTIRYDDTVEDFLQHLRDNGLQASFHPTNHTITIRAGAAGGTINLTADNPEARGLLAALGTSQHEINAVNALPTWINGLTTVTPGIDAEMSEFIPGLENGGVRINGVNVAVLANDTFRTFINRVNSITSVGVQMDFNSTLNSFTIEPTNFNDFARIHTMNTTAGAGAPNGDSQGILAFMGLDSVYWYGNTPDERLIRRAQDAIIHYDVNGLPGDSIELKQASNTFEIHGVNITLSSAVTQNAVFTVSTERNVDDTMDAIRNFVEEYNNLIRLLNTLHTTPRARANNSARGAFFEPLSDEQRSAMSDREIERWEEQAKIGLLHRDRDIRNLHDQIRRAMFDPVILSSTVDENGRRIVDSISLFNIGITTVGRDGAPGDQLIGVLQIDEDRLRAELEKDPERVSQLFSRTPVQAGNMTGANIRERNERAPHVGLGFRLDDILRTAADDDMGPFRQRAGYTRGMTSTDNVMSRQIREYDRRMADMQAFLLRRENHFYAMFARMEQAMAQSHAQMDSLFAFMQQ
jgi:flagellar hook-associated protein 2